MPVTIQSTNLQYKDSQGNFHGINAIKGDTGGVDSVAGKTGVVTLDGNDVTFNDAATYNDGTIGGTVADLKSQITGKVNVAQGVENAGKALVVGADGNVAPGDMSGGDVTTEQWLYSFPTDTVSGAVASFSDGGDNLPVKDLTIGIEPVQSGSGDPGPENVRPISGWTGANVTRTGANIANVNSTEGLLSSVFAYDPESQIFTLKAKREQSLWLFHKFEKPVPIGAVISMTFIALSGNLKDKALTLGLYHTSTGNAWSASSFNIIQNTNFNNNVYTANFTVRNKPAEYIIVWAHGTYIPDVTQFKLQLEYGAATQYQPYIGATYPISWQAEAGTVYGGMLDVTTGLLTVTHGNIASYNGESLPGKWISSMDVYSPGGTPTTGAQVVYELATPQTYQLTPTEVTLLLGTNNMCADTGDTTVTYRADPTLYADKRANATRSIIVGIEPTMTASKAYTTGQLLIVGDTLYKVAAPIASGATLTPGTNVNPTTVAEQLILLANA